MQTDSRTVLVLGGLLLLGTPSAVAQSPGSLGGYGAASSFAGPSMSNGGPMIVPYGGMFEGFMPGRMGGGSSLSFRSRPTAVMGASRTSFSLAPMGRSMGTGSSSRDRMTSPFESRGGMGLGGMSRSPIPGGRSVMPPSIGYPFRQPPSLVSPSGTVAGMSM